MVQVFPSTPKPLLVLGALTLLTLTACSSQTQDGATSTPDASPSSSAVATGAATASAATSPVSTPTSTSQPTQASPSAGTSTPSAEPSIVVQEPQPIPTAEQPPATTEATQNSSAPGADLPSPTVSVITVPAPGNQPTPTHGPSDIPVAGTDANLCDYSSIHIAAATTEGAAGSRYINLTFTNSGAAPCTLAGWPSVHYVDASGQTIGAPASHAAEWTSSGELLLPGHSAQATLRETRANLYGDSCRSVTAAGYRVGIPGTDSSLTLAFPAEACSNESVSQLSVGQVGALP